MKVLLVNPPQKEYPGSKPFVVNLPLGLLYIGTYLKDNFVDVEILDTTLENSQPKKDGDVKFYGMSWKKIEHKIRVSKADIIGVSGHSSAQIDSSYWLMKLVKEIDDNILTVAGGPHISASSISYLKEVNDCDIAVIGEGEYTMLDITKYVEGKLSLDQIKGINYNYDNVIKKNIERKVITDIDHIPIPDYGLLNMDDYFRSNKMNHLNMIPMITSRGCPYNCVFCSIHIHMGRKWRPNSSDYVIKHIDHVIDNYDINHISFNDDNLTLDKERIEEILDYLIQDNVNITWDTPNGIRADGLNRDVFQKMKESGCTSLSIGVESGDPYILENIIQKNLLLEDVVKTSEICKEFNIPLSAFFVIGFPGEKKENMKKTVKFAEYLKEAYNVNPLIMIATPLFKTRLYDICSKNGYFSQDLSPRAFAEATQFYGNGLIRTEDFTPEDVKKIVAASKKRLKIISFKKYFKNPTLFISKPMNNKLRKSEIIKRALRVKKLKVYLLR